MLWKALEFWEVWMLWSFGDLGGSGALGGLDALEIWSSGRYGCCGALELWEALELRSSRNREVSRSAIEGKGINSIDPAKQKESTATIDGIIDRISGGVY